MNGISGTEIENEKKKKKTRKKWWIRRGFFFFFLSDVCRLRIRFQTFEEFIFRPCWFGNSCLFKF